MSRAGALVWTRRFTLARRRMQTAAHRHRSAPWLGGAKATEQCISFSRASHSRSYVWFNRSDTPADDVRVVVYGPCKSPAHLSVDGQQVGRFRSSPAISACRYQAFRHVRQREFVYPARTDKGRERSPAAGSFVVAVALDWEGSSVVYARAKPDMEVMKNRRTATGADRTTTESLDQLTSVFRFQQGVGVLGRERPFSLTHRVGALGPITVLDLTFGADTWIRCSDDRPYYQVNVLAAGQMDLTHRGSRIYSAPGLASVCVPDGALTVSRWTAGTRMIGLRLDRDVLEDALGEALDQPVTAQIDFNPSIITTTGPARSLLHVFSVLAQELFHPDTVLAQPLVASPFVDAVIHAVLLGTDHPHREMLTSPSRSVAPRNIRPAIDMIEAEPQLPLTVTSLASRCHISSRALQQGFVRNVGMSPMAYLRHVRLRRAHQELLAADPSVETVASITKRWGYTNPGRFAAVYAARYGETPAATLRRSPHARSVRQLRVPTQRARPLPVPDMAVRSTTRTPTTEPTDRSK